MEPPRPHKKELLCFRKRNFLMLQETFDIAGSFKEQKAFILFLIKKQNFLN